MAPSQREAQHQRREGLHVLNAHLPIKRTLESRYIDGLYSDTLILLCGGRAVNGEVGLEFGRARNWESLVLT